MNIGKCFAEIRNFADALIGLCTKRADWKIHPETNFGKTVFYATPEIPNEFSSWDEIPYAPYVDMGIFLYFLLMAAVFIKGKLFAALNTWVRRDRLVVVNSAVLAATAAATLIVDKALEDPIFEEMIALVFYTSLAATSCGLSVHRNRLSPNEFSTETEARPAVGLL